FIGALDDGRHSGSRDNGGRSIRAAVAQNQNGAGLGISAAFEADDDAISNLFLTSQRRFEVLGINVHARGRDDHFFFTSLEEKITLLIERAQVAGAIPAISACDRLQFASVPVAAGDAAAAHENFAVVRQLDFAPGQDLADGTAAGVERMVQADQRRGFGQSVSLDDGVSQAMPEFFGRAVEGGAAADHGPKLPSEAAAQVAEGPPAPQKVLAPGGGVAGGKILATAAAIGTVIATDIEIAFDFLLQRLDHARDGHQHRDAFAADRRHDFGWVECVLEHDGRAQQRGKKNSQELAEDMAERQQVQEAKRMHKPLVLQVLLDLGFNRGQVADHVGVGEHDSLGLGGGAGSENNFERIGRLNLSGTN